MWISRSRDTVSCFYCNTPLRLITSDSSSTSDSDRRGKRVERPVAVGPDSSEYWCSVCGSFNKRNSRGEILPDETAYILPEQPSTSFASPSPAVSTPLGTASSSPFCRQCLSNQSLQIHLLSSYPDSDSDEGNVDDKDDGDRNDSFPPLPEYQRTLDLRYPLVCSACAPRVESTIKERDYRVKTQALGWRLRETRKLRDREDRLCEEAVRRQGRRWVVNGIVWRARGVLWLLTHVGTVLWSFYDSLTMRQILRRTVIVLPLTLSSPAWAFWDPTWSRLRSETVRGRNVTVRYRRLYLTVQAVACVLRIVATLAITLGVGSPNRVFTVSIMFSTVLALVAPLCFPRISPRPPILLSNSAAPSPARPSSPDDSTYPVPDPLEPLSNLSLSSRSSLLALSPRPASPGRGPNSASQRSSETRRRRGWIERDAAKFGQPAFGFPVGSARTGPVGGAPSFPHASGADDEMELEPTQAAGPGRAVDPDTSMDWTPLDRFDPTLTPSPLNAPSFGRSERAGDGVGIVFARPRFIPPDSKPATGLEPILASFGIGSTIAGGMGTDGDRTEGDESGDMMEVDQVDGRKGEDGQRKKSWWAGWFRT
ncbi:hypothetical protein JCM10212_003692 [Sporobolomyces blumeae]